MPYKNKEKLKEYQKGYFKKNKAILNLKRGRRSIPNAQSQVNPCSIPVTVVTTLDSLRAKIKEIERPATNNVKVVEVEADYTVEPVYE